MSADRTQASVAVRLISGTAARARETGQPAFAASANFWNWGVGFQYLLVACDLRR